MSVVPERLAHLKGEKEEGGKCSLRPPSRAGAEALECRALNLKKILLESIDSTNL